MTLPKHVQSILWDVNPKELGIQKHRSFIITRLTEKGTWKDIQWLRKKYSLTSIKSTVARSRNTSSKTKNFWKNF